MGTLTRFEFGYNRWQFYGYYTTPTRELVGLNAGAFELGVQLRMGK
jgi:hypothetical protein